MTTVHGGLDVAELRSLGLEAAQVMDFSSNINPLGPSPRVREAAAQADLSSYPDRRSLALREALAARLGIGIETLLIGNGSTELIHLLARACLRAGDNCLIFEPTFGEYREAANLAGARTFGVRARHVQAFRWPMDTALQTIGRIQPSLVFLCNPNNPTGVYLCPDTVRKLQKAIGANGLLMLDDAYVWLADHPWDTTPLLEGGDLAILRSMTKDHALAGVRLGYLVADPDLISAVGRLQPAWSVNAVAQAVGLATLEDTAHLIEAGKVISESKAYLCQELENLGVPVTTSSTNFILARVGDGARVRTALLRRGLVVRDCASFSLPEYIRIAIRRRKDCAQLVEAMGEVMSDGR